MLRAERRPLSPSVFGGLSEVPWDSLIRPELGPMRPYQPGLREDQVRERSGRERILKLSSNEHPDGPVPAALAAIAALGAGLNRYPDGSCDALKRRLAEHWGVEKRHVAIGSGSNELLRLIAQAVLRPGDEVVYAWPSFVVYPMACQMFDGKAVPLPLDTAHAHDLEAMAAAVTERTKLVFLCNPNNPTGTIYDREAFERFLDRVPPKVLVVADEAYFEFVVDPAYPDSLRYFDGVRPLAVLRTFSKIYSLAGLRVGYGVMPEPLVHAIEKIREPFNVGSLGQAAARASLDDTAEVERRRAENEEQKKAIYACFDRLGIRYVPSHANFVYFMTERPVEVFEALLNEGVIARDFGDSPGLRLGVGAPADTEATIAAFEAVRSRLGSI